MKTNLNLYSGIVLATEDGQFQLMVDSSLTGNPNFIRTLHTHTSHELFYIAKGSLDMVFQDRTLTLTDNTLLVIPPDTLHYTWSEDPDVQRYVLYFQVLDLAAGTSFREAFDAVEPIAFTHPAQVQNVFLRLSRYSRKIPEVCRGLMASCFYELLYLLKEELLTRQLSDREQEPPPSLIANNMDREYRNYVIDDYINLHLTEDLSLATLAEKVYLSQRHVNRILRQNYGQTFRERVTWLRLQNAVKLLLETDKTVKAISAEVGYRSIYAFYRSFEKTYGNTPESYRKANKG